MVNRHEFCFFADADANAIGGPLPVGGVGGGLAGVIGHF